MSERPCAPAAERNKDPILEVLQEELSDRTKVLEIGSGTGQHAVHFGKALPGVIWQTSELPGHHAGIEAWRRWSGLRNVLPPLALDVSTAPPLPETYDAVFSSNTAHIMHVDQVEQMFTLVGDALVPAGVFCLYGPFNVYGRFTSDSNAAFDAELRAQDPGMGIRDLAELDRFAAAAGLVRVRRYAMPANNQIVVWEKTAEAAAR